MGTYSACFWRMAFLVATPGRLSFWNQSYAWVGPPVSSAARALLAASLCM